MMEGAPEILDFAAVDGLAFAAECGRLNGQAIPAFVAKDIGPLIEFSQLSAVGTLPPLGSSPLMRLSGLTKFVDALESGRSQWFCPTSRHKGLLRTEHSPPADAVWTGFGLSAQKAAKAAGFPRRIACQFVAAMGEFYNNIYEHAKTPDTGIIAFSAMPDRFEFVVADRGIGVLNSLRSTATYCALADHGKALQLVLTDGVSRYGAATNRGHGFRPLFVGLANLNGSLRFRSGDHALLINGQQPSLMNARVAQKPDLQGFLIAVSCIVDK